MLPINTSQFLKQQDRGVNCTFCVLGGSPGCVMIDKFADIWFNITVAMKSTCEHVMYEIVQITKLVSGYDLPRLLDSL